MNNTMKDLGAKAFSYGYASPVLMAATYNDDGTVNVMNLHEVARSGREAHRKRFRRASRRKRHGAPTASTVVPQNG